MRPVVSFVENQRGGDHIGPIRLRELQGCCEPPFLKEVFRFSILGFEKDVIRVRSRPDEGTATSGGNRSQDHRSVFVLVHPVSLLRGGDGVVVHEVPLGHDVHRAVWRGECWVVVEESGVYDGDPDPGSAEPC